MIAIATFAGLPDGDEDCPALLAALGELGLAAEPVAWNAPGVDWAAYELVVVRSTWDYTGRLAEFLTWADGVPNLANPASVLRWNTDKRYLRELAEAGVPVVPTLWDPGELPGGDGWEHLVIKPAVSAGAADTARWGPGEEAAAREHLAALTTAGRTVMVQPYLSAVDTMGETALIFIDGAFSHAIRKAPILARGSGVQERISSLDDPRAEVEPAEATTGELAVAELALAAAHAHGHGELLYARVDLIPDAEGEPVVLELELTEPSLFLGRSPGAVHRLASAVAHRLR